MLFGPNRSYLKNKIKSCASFDSLLQSQMVYNRLVSAYIAGQADYPLVYVPADRLVSPGLNPLISNMTCAAQNHSLTHVLSLPNLAVLHGGMSVIGTPWHKLFTLAATVHGKDCAREWTDLAVMTRNQSQSTICFHPHKSSTRFLDVREAFLHL